MLCVVRSVHPIDVLNQHFRCQKYKKEKINSNDMRDKSQLRDKIQIADNSALKLEFKFFFNSNIKNRDFFRER